MTDRAPPESFTHIRRQDRAVDDERWIRAFLHHAPVANIATVRDGQPLLHVNTYVFDEPANTLYFHTGRHGCLRDAVETDARVCFAVSDMGRLLPADRAMNFSVEYASVVVFGRARVVTDGGEARRALQALLDKYFPHLHAGRDYRATTDEELARTSVFCIEIDAWTAKRKVEAAGFPGAFPYRPAPATGQADVGGVEDAV
jgi:uncharacterized protein